MDKRQTRTYDTFTRLVAFLDAHPLDSPPPLLVEKRVELKETVDLLSSLAVAQVGETRAARAIRVKARRDHLRQEVLMPLMKVVKPLLSGAPGTEKLFRIPHARASHGAIAAHTIAVAAGLQPYADLLASAGYPDTFLGELRAEGEALAAANSDLEAARSKGTQDAHDVRTMLKRGMAAASVIEGILLVQLLRGNPDLQERWRKARRIPARQGRPPKSRRRTPVSELPFEAQGDGAT